MFRSAPASAALGALAAFVAMPLVAQAQTDGAPAQSRQLPAEALDADRERYPGQPANVRRGVLDDPLTISRVMGKEIRLSTGERAGEIEDVLIDRSGTASAIVELEDRTVLIPWSELAVTPVNEDLTVSMTMGELSAFPAWEGRD